MSIISKGNDIPHINSIVDLDNALSLKYELPVGVHDIDNFISDIRIKESDGNDNFIPFGGTEIEHPDVGEIIYASGDEIKSRRWTWRQGERKLQNNLRTFLFLLMVLFLTKIKF